MWLLQSDRRRCLKYLPLFCFLFLSGVLFSVVAWVITGSVFFVCFYLSLMLKTTNSYSASSTCFCVFCTGKENERICRHTRTKTKKMHPLFFFFYVPKELRVRRCVTLTR
uniref:Putative conserved protein with signal anchor n=1 Tax=Ixodes scapularis TaxID=6945 RepID=A0A4D5S701_IXOSC